METRSNFGSQNFGTTKIRDDNEDSDASINLPLTLSRPSARVPTRASGTNQRLQIVQATRLNEFERPDHKAETAVTLVAIPEVVKVDDGIHASINKLIAA
jgi:hypothetical protein